MEARVYILAICMLLTGSLNTIATKYQVKFRGPHWLHLAFILVEITKNFNIAGSFT